MRKELFLNNPVFTSVLRVFLGLICLTMYSHLVACSSSSEDSNSSSSDVSQNNEEQDPAQGRQLVLAFESAPLDPNVFNILASEERLERHFNPGEQLRIYWTMSLKLSDNSELIEGESHLYDAKVYISSDDEINETDLELFSIECSFPETSAHACGRYASFITEYAPDNQNILSTISIPLDKPLGLNDYQVDSTSFLDVIPKETKLLISACLRQQPSSCDLFSIDISLL